MSACVNMTNSTCAPGFGFFSASGRLEENIRSIADSKADDGICRECVAGKIKDGTNSEICQICDPGQWQNETRRTSCKLCPIGKKLTDASGPEFHDDSSDCEDCRVLEYNPFEGSVECYSCLTAKVTGSSECEGCNPGLYKVTVEVDGNREDECRQCPLGWFSAKQNVKSCEACPRGYYANNEKSGDGVIIRFDRCLSCGRGMFGAMIKASSKNEGCVNCPGGTYSEMEGIASVGKCTGCPSGRWSLETGVTKESSCVNCDAGKYATVSTGANSIDSCIKCIQGKFSETVGSFLSTSCQTCPTGFSQDNPGQAYCLPCVRGKYGQNQGCIGCPEGELKYFLC